MSEQSQVLTEQLQAQVEALTQALTETQQQLVYVTAQRDMSSLLFEINNLLHANLDIEAIARIVTDLAGKIGASIGEIYLLTHENKAYFSSSWPERNRLSSTDRQALVEQALNQGLEADVLQTKQARLISDAQQHLESALIGQFTPIGSIICAPVTAPTDEIQGVVIFGHVTPNQFQENNLTLLTAILEQVTPALEKACHLSEMETSLQETHIMLDTSRHLAGATMLDEVYRALIKSVLETGADRCTVYMCEELGKDNVPVFVKAVLVGDVDSEREANFTGDRFKVTRYPIFYELIHTQETFTEENISLNARLTVEDKAFLTKFETCGIVINPLVTRNIVMGFVAVEYRTLHHFSERELALYRTLCNQTTIAIENARQRLQTEEALAETQTLYRAGRVLAGAAGLQEILEESLIEFVYSLGLDQGGVTLISADKTFGQLMAYLEGGQLQKTDKQRFPIDESLPYQKTLFMGKPFTSIDVPNDPQLKEFITFNQEFSIKSTLQAPMIIRGETIGWIGADAIQNHREFTQREIDLARAMADQIAITIQNRRLLEQTALRADRLKAVAKVGEVVAGLTELNEVLNLTADLIRDRFGFYHVSIFLLDESGEWAVVRASTGEIGKIMVERPHRLGVGSNSIVGYVTQKGEPRIALDVGEDAVHFQNPLLPDTRSEMALPLILRQDVIGALDVQSVEPNAFSDEDVETLQIMADQLTAAISNTRLFEQIQTRLAERDKLYQLGTETGGTLDLHKAANILTARTADVLDVSECALSLLEEDETVYVISDYVKEDSQFQSDQGKRFELGDFPSWPKVLDTQQALTLYLDSPDEGSWKSKYLQDSQGAAMATAPILLRNKVIGLLEIYDDRPKRRFEAAEISLLESIALQASNIIENAHLYHQAQESQTFIKAIIDQIPDPIFIKDREHRWIVVNTAFAEGILGQPEEKVIGRSDYDFLPKEEADGFWADDNKMFDTGEIQETEESITNHLGEERILYTRKIPLTLTEGETKPEYLIGIIHDITQRKQRELERERLIEDTRRTLDRTQTLYRISDALATSTNPKETYEKVLGEFLKLLGLKHGSITLFDEATNTNRAQARYIDGEVTLSTLVLPVDDDPVYQHLKHNLRPLIIEDAQHHPLVKDILKQRGHHEIQTMLFIPLVVREQLVGNIILDVIDEGYTFRPGDIDIGEAIADQLTIWLENRRLLNEEKYRSDRLQTAAEVSRAASSILDVGELINTSVNLIRDQFDFYYVGMFLVDEAGEWAVLRAGTGEAGKIQLEKNHRLKIGGESMIGWSVQNCKARIALDVGEEAVWFNNPYLPETHSEMALPLISRDEVIGALTVQSVERNAFSNEDITMLQTMADQLANAIDNARLFDRVATAQKEAETRLQETQALQQLSQALAGTLKVDEVTEAFFQTCTQLLDFDFVMVSLVDEAQQSIRAIAGHNVADSYLKQTMFTLDSDNIVVNIVKSGKTEIIQGWDDRFDKTIYEAEGQAGWGARVFTPITLRSRNLGVIEAGYQRRSKVTVQESQVSLLRTFTDQTALALESAQRYESTQRTAQREKVIREITGKIRNSVTVDDILKTTVTELSKIVGTSKGGITLSAQPNANTPQTEIQEKSRPKTHGRDLAEIPNQNNPPKSNGKEVDNNDGN